MTNKLFSLVLSFALILAGFGVFSVANAQVATPVPFPTFPAGCSSALGYSITTGLPCSGTSVATSMPAGCTTALGFSVTSGVPCSGTSVALPYLAGCLSIFGFSSITSQPCNGTAFAEGTVVTPPVTPPVVVVPGLPTTGAGGSAAVNIALLVGSGLISLFGIAYLAKRRGAF
jgi:hypothetical protein